VRNYIIRRLLILIPTVLLVTIIVFFVVFLVPGDIIDAMRSKALDVVLDRAAIEKALGLDAPVIIQYGRWLGVVPQADGNLSGLFQGDFGVSWWQSLPVVELIAPRWPVTLELGVMSLIIAQLIALPVGIFSALRQDTWGDYIGRSFAIMCIAVPGFWLGTMVIVFPSIWWGYMPPIMLIPYAKDPIGHLKMFIVPATVLGMAMCGMTMRMIRTMMLEVLRQDYVRTAWSKGL
jgi:peptide/nickel transport system permease protein